MKSLLLLLCSCFSCFLHCLGTCYSKPESNIKIIKILTPSNTAQSLFKPFLRNQLATKAQSFPQKSSNTMSAMIACHKQSAQRFHMKSRLRFKFSTPWKTLIIKFPPPRGGQRCQIPRVWLGEVGGILKLRFDRYNVKLWFDRYIKHKTMCKILHTHELNYHPSNNGSQKNLEQLEKPF